MDDIHDVIILGGGCAGLALARELAGSGKALRVAIIEPRLSYEEDRTWCFWAGVEEDVSPSPVAEWQRWAFSSADVRIMHKARTWRYVLMRSADYYCHALNIILQAPRIDLRLGVSAGAVRLVDGVCRVEADGTMLFARRVVDTRPPSLERLGAAPFAQVFRGFEVETDSDTFDPRAALLMGDTRVDGEGVAFDYVLPLTPRRALFEHTVFSKHPPCSSSLDEVCGTRMRALCGSSARIVREERGWIPMGLPVAPPQGGPIIRAGTTGGAVRSSSGYAFRRIQRWARTCALTLARGGMPVAMKSDRSLVSFMDRVFLRAMAQHTDRTPGYFLKIARALDGDQFARFMSDQATAMDWLRVVAALPKGDFIAALGSRFFEHGKMRS